MNETTLETPGRSLFDVLARRSTVAVATFFIVSLLGLAFALMHHVKYAALSHVALVNDLSGRDPMAAAIDMPAIATGSSVLSDVRSELGLSDSVEDLRSAVTARVAPRSSLMTIAAQDHDPHVAMTLVNTVASSFAKYYLHLGSARYEVVAQRLSADVRAARARLTLLDRRLEVAAAGAAYVGSQTSLDASAMHLGELQENRGLALAQYVTDQANLDADHARPGKTAKAVRHEILQNNAQYRETEALVSRDVAQYMTTRAGVTSLYPGIAGFNDKIRKEAAELAALRAKALAARDAYSPALAFQQAQTERDAAAVAGDRVKLAAFDQQIHELKGRLMSAHGDAPSMGALRAARDAAEAQLNALSLRLSNAEANGAEASSLGAVVVVDRATDARPTLVGPLFLFVLGLIAALLASIGAAYAAELLVPRLLEPSDVESVYGRPVLATLRPN